MAIKDKNGIEPSRLTNKYGSDVLRVVDKNGNTLYRQQQEIVYSAKVKTQGAWVNIDDYLCSAKTVVKFKLFVPKNVPVLPDYGTIIGRSRNDSEFFWFAWQNNTSTRFAYYVKNKYQSWLPYPAQAFDKLVNIEMSCNNIIVDDVVFAGNPSDYVAPENGIQIFASKKGAYLDYIMGICGITIGSNIEIYDKQDDGSLVLKRNLYFVPAGDTQHSAIPAPVGGACWCRVTNRYYNVLQNDGVGELEFEPISVNKNPRTEYSVEVAETGAYFDIYDFQIKDTSRFKFKYRRDNVLEDGYNTLLGNYQWATNGIWLSTGTFKRPCWCYYVSSEKVVNKLIENTLGIDIDIEATVSNLKFNGINVVTTNMTTFNNPSIGINIFQDKTFGFPSKPDGGMFKSNILFLDGVAMERELIPVPEGDVQYSDIPAPKGGALWDRVTNKYYAKQGTGALKFTPLPRLALVSTGTQYINTGVAPSSESTFIAEYIPKYNSSFICSKLEEGSHYGILHYYNTESIYGIHKQRIQDTAIVFASKKLNVYQSKKGIAVNGQYLPRSSYASYGTSSIPLTLFAQNSSSGVINYSSFSLFKLTQYTGNTLTQNLIPVKQGDTFYKKDSTPAPSNCMYDTVTDTYFQNAGTGTFKIVEENPYYNLVDGTELFKDDKTITEFNYDTPYLTNMTRMFQNSTVKTVNMNTTNVIRASNAFAGNKSLDGTITLDLSSSNDNSSIFNSGSALLKKINLKIKSSHLLGAFSGLGNLEEVYYNGNKVIEHVGNLYWACSKLRVYPLEMNKITHSYGMCRGCKAMTRPIRMDNILELSGAYYGCINLEWEDITYSNCGNASSYYGGFCEGCTKLVRAFDMPKVRALISAYKDCSVLVRGPSEYPLLISAKDCFLNCALPKEEIVRLIANLPQFTGTPDATSGQGYITFTGCPGCASMTAEDWKVGEDKGWVVER